MTEPYVDELTMTKNIIYMGHSLGITMTKECDNLNITRGDLVEVHVVVKKRYHE